MSVWIQPRPCLLSLKAAFRYSSIVRQLKKNKNLTIFFSKFDWHVISPIFKLADRMRSMRTNGAS